MRVPFTAPFLLACLFLTPAALALTQPDGTLIPVKKTNLKQDLQTIFDLEMETIDVMADAAVMPETFDPTCNLTFTMISRGTAGFQNIFGWYNATSAQPPASDLQVLIPCTAQPPQAFPLSIKTDPAYLGGKIGFFMITPENTGDSCASLAKPGYVYYSERKHNPDNGGSPNPYIHLLIYDSKKLSKSFYFAWEDLFGGGDNEFADLVTRVDGISCAGGGAPCDTGKKGICAAGTMQCQNGTLTCVQQQMPGAPMCNGFDNNCDGVVDTDCLGGKTCDKGQCQPKCGTGEFQCNGGLVCNAAGVCVDGGCDKVTCSAGKVCVAGACVGPCDGVVCPSGQTCTAAGVCVDPCKALTCGADAVCVAGTCVDKCGCGGCKTGSSCLPSGLCAPTACMGKACAPGEICADDGSCKDTCAGAKCPGGGVCATGVCGPPKNGSGGAGGNVGAGGNGASTGIGGAFIGGGGKGGKPGSGGNAGSGTGGNAKGGGGAGGATPPSASPADGSSSGGCGCRTTSGSTGGVVALLAAIPLLAARRRRRRDTPRISSP